jgi:adenosylhomocysteine nucleosidase
LIRKSTAKVFEMAIGLLSALENESTKFLELLDERKELEFLNHSFTLGKISNNNIVFSTSGAGKVNASCIASLMICKFKPKCIINFGTAGGFSNILGVGDIYLPSSFCQHDVIVDPFPRNFVYPNIPEIIHADQGLLDTLNDFFHKIKVSPKTGIMCTGDSFVTVNRSNLINNKHTNSVAVDMEASAISQVCYLLSIPFASVKIITDLVDSISNEEQFSNNYGHQICILSNYLYGFLCEYSMC